METKKETVVCVYSTKSDFLLQLIDKINKNENAPFYFVMYHIPVISEKAVSKCIQYVKQEGKNCVLCLSDTSSYLCTIVNERLGFPSPSPHSIAICRNKYQTRMFVSEFEWFFGFNLGDPIDLVVQNVKTYPCMLKPTMLVGGRGAYRCDDESSLRSKLQSISADEEIVESVKAIHEESKTLRASDDEKFGKSYQYLVEEFIEMNGTDVYMYYAEVFVTLEGKVIPYSVAEEILFEDGMFLGFMIPPLHLDGDIKPFEEYCTHIGEKLYSVGFKNQGFNIEFWRYPNGKFRLIEINPRISTPSVDVHEQYSGNNICIDVTDMLLHNKVPTRTPLSLLKERVSTNTHEEEYSLIITFCSRAMGVVSSIIDYDLLEALSAKGYVVLFYSDRDDVVTKVEATRLGKHIAYVTIKGTWNEIVREEKSLREKLFMGLPQYKDCFKYPKFFAQK